MWIRIRTLLFIKVIQISDHWTTDPQDFILSVLASNVSVHCPQWLHFESQKLLNFDFHAEPDPDHAFRSNADPIRIQLPK
jgi:hypothetical protein